MTKTEALKNLYAALGGSLSDTYPSIAEGAPVSDYEIISDVVAAISEKAASAGIELPAVTADDNGKLLTVVNGAWDKASNYEPITLNTWTSATTIEYNASYKDAHYAHIFAVVTGAWSATRTILVDLPEPSNYIARHNLSFIRIRSVNFAEGNSDYFVGISDIYDESVGTRYLVAPLNYNISIPQGTYLIQFDYPLA